MTKKAETTEQEKPATVQKPLPRKKKKMGKSGKTGG